MEDIAMLDRRRLLQTLLLLAPVLALASACDHLRPDQEEEKKDPFKRQGGGY